MECQNFEMQGRESRIFDDKQWSKAGKIHFGKNNAERFIKL